MIDLTYAAFKNEGGPLYRPEVVALEMKLSRRSSDDDDQPLVRRSAAPGGDGGQPLTTATAAKLKAADGGQPPAAAKADGGQPPAPKGHRPPASATKTRSATAPKKQARGKLAIAAAQMDTKKKSTGRASRKMALLEATMNTKAMADNDAHSLSSEEDDSRSETIE